MNPNEYRLHSQAPLRRAFFRGEQAALAGVPLGNNPYRVVKVKARARRGSWSEAFTKAWATGWREADRNLRAAGLADASATQGRTA